MKYSVGPHISLTGKPQSSGHYFCSVTHDGYETQSTIATFVIRG